MTQRAFLNVEASLTQRRWIGPSPQADRLAEAMGQSTALPLALCHMLVTRGVAPADTAAYLAPALRDLMPDPQALRDMTRAATRLLHAITTGQRIAIFADYDVDGGSSAALLIVWLRAMDRTATLFIPDRIEEGYGPNVPAMATLLLEHPRFDAADLGSVVQCTVGSAPLFLLLSHQRKG